MRRQIELGLLYSRSGAYTLLSQACRSGALAAVAAINDDPDRDVTFAPVERDPGGNADHYGPLCADILRDTTARHVIGCVTSWSRKEVIPVLEKHGGTLWYACPYEGFEASDHVVYTHACPNQHLLPLLAWAMPVYGRRVWLTGSNYIWGWEINRLARETVTTAGGEVLGERYLPIGSVEVDRMIAEIRHARPDFVLNSLIGPSSYAFLAAYAVLAADDPHFRTCPVLSCNLTEAELPAIGPAAEGLIAAGPYFSVGPAAPFGNSFEAAAFAAVTELARLLDRRPAAERAALPDLLASAPAGMVDRKTHHTTLPVLIARVQDGAFRVIHAQDAVAGDPYLTAGHDLAARPSLRVVQ
jgi:branched-chain amino acid transport system substrate-binding protein